MFDHLSFYPFAVTVGFVRAKTSVRPRISDDVIMHEVVEGGVFEFLGHGRTKNWVVLCGFHQDWFQSVVIYKTCMPHANVMKKVRWGLIQPCAIFGRTRLFSWVSGSFNGECDFYCY